VLLDHREQIAEEGALLGAQVAGDVVDDGSARALRRLADAEVSTTVGGGPVLGTRCLGGGVLAVAEGFFVQLCALLWRNRMPS
jgi:hypothetical protein